MNTLNATPSGSSNRFDLVVQSELRV
jgi:hypothetical protein